MYDLTSYVSRLRYEDLPDQQVEIAKKSILDTLGCLLAGSSADGCERLVHLVNRWGGEKEGTLLVYGNKVPAPSAALVNCTMARARDLDDVHEGGGGHVSATIVPSAFIISEYSKMYRNRSINGKDLILAISLGSDLHCRLRMAGKGVAAGGGWLGETFAPIAVAAMGGKMLGFNEEKTANAMGIAYAQCAGNLQANVEGALTVRLQQGLCARAGVLSIILAEEGFTGPKDILEGKYGLYPLYCRGEYASEILKAQLGEQFEGRNVSIKPYPCCKLTHGAIYGALQLAEEYEIKANHIEKVTIFTSRYAYNIAGGEWKVRPQTVPDAQFSYYYTVATALVKGGVFISDFTKEAIRDANVLAMARRVEVVVDSEKDKLQVVIPPTDIEIRTNDGKHYKKTIDFVKGHPKNPMSVAECIQKLKDCARFSASALAASDIDEVSQMVKEIDELDDVTVILERLA